MDAEVSAREAEVLAALGERLTNAEIAAKLFISVRTVESHVSALLRKFGVADRRALAAVAVGLETRGPDGPTGLSARLPVPLTPFVGRGAERTELTGSLMEHRLVTAVGPGGIGKTRLALAVAGDVCDLVEDGVVYVDLVPVTDPDMIPAAIRDAAGVGEQQARSAEETVTDWLRDRQVLLVLDNCEHLLDGVAALVERLLGACPALRVLATSRARLMVPFETVFLVPGLSTTVGDDGRSEALALFLGRASAAGAPLEQGELVRLAEICRRLDGMALAIELAAARLPSLGVDGLEVGLSDQVGILTGGRRADERHRSLEAALDWSHDLLTEPERAVLRRVSVFASPFTAAAAEELIGGWGPVGRGRVAGILADLAEQSLLIPTAARGGIRYRALETIRQYGAMRLAEADESSELAGRHLDWCLRRLGVLAGGATDDPDWRARVDEVCDECRAAVTTAVERGATGAGYELAGLLAEVSYTRGRPGEAQRRYEQAAALAPDDTSAAHALSLAAGAAEARHFGNEALRLRRIAADRALAAGDRPRAATELARAGELINRGPGLMATAPPPGLAEALVAEARPLAVGDPRAESRLATAESLLSEVQPDDFRRLVEKGLAMARQLGDPLAESAALDQVTAIQLGDGRLDDALGSALHRTEIVASLITRVDAALEVFDAHGMAADCAVAVGDLRLAHTLGNRIRALPFNREEAHLGVNRLMLVAMFAGDWDETLALGDLFRESWVRVGRPRAGNLSRGASAALTVAGLRGDAAAVERWREVVEAIAVPETVEDRCGRPTYYFFESLVELHLGRAAAAFERLEMRPQDFPPGWFTGLWMPWYATSWVEAAVLVGAAEATGRLDAARTAVRGNPVAGLLVDRAQALHDGDAAAVQRLPEIALRLEEAGFRYQAARTRVMAGGEHRERGEAELEGLGAVPMPWPVHH
ncbi:ATP-binding protein [Spongisporangium articulatum]|uniref:ATP-binding protein n=1 Tax=Spongisporangium articulatum TaxID=3362603 RepID=A0ABW8AL78_9ACTN